MIRIREVPPHKYVNTYSTYRVAHFVSSFPKLLGHVGERGGELAPLILVKGAAARRHAHRGAAARRHLGHESLGYEIGKGVGVGCGVELGAGGSRGWGRARGWGFMG